MSSQATNINDIFFEGIYQDVWRKLIHPGLSEAECDFIQEIAQLKKGDKVLDIMCGYGRHALELARRGFNVTAVDNLEAYISEIQKIAATENLPVDAHASGALEVVLKDQFKAVVCMGNSFAFFDRNDAVELLKKLSAHLEEDGVLIINSWMIAEIAIKHFKEREWHEMDGYKYLLHYKFQFQPSRIESVHTIISEDGNMEVINGVDYIFTLSEFETMFNEAGLKTKDFYSTPRRRPFQMGDSRVYLVAEKIDK